MSETSIPAALTVFATVLEPLARGAHAIDVWQTNACQHAGTRGASGRMRIHFSPRPRITRGFARSSPRQCAMSTNRE
jgi:hypothetical protein